jgi:two-component system OmpR family response regulator
MPQGRCTATLRVITPALVDDCVRLADGGNRSPWGVRILLVEDDDGLAGEISNFLAGRGFQLTRVATGRAARETLADIHVDLLILDRMLPEMDGLSIIRWLRSERNQVPVLVLSALAATDDKILGLAAGGDDYLPKPFAFGELAARVTALLRRPVAPRETILRAGPLEVDLIDRSVRRGNREIQLLPRELRLLEYLMYRPNQVVSRAMLLRDVWKYRFVPKTNLVDVHVGKLRRKVDVPGDVALLHVIRGAGYMLRV